MRKTELTDEQWHRLKPLLLPLRRAIKSTIPACKRQRKRPQRGRPTRAGPGYGERWKVERAFAWCGNFRRLLVWHERYLAVFRAFFLVAFIVIALRQS